MRRLVHVLLLVPVALSTWTRAEAQSPYISLPPPTVNAAQNGVISSLAYDGKHQVYLQVWVNACQVYGQMIGVNGVPRGNAFAIAVARQTCAGFPSVAYSEGSGDDMFFVLFSSDYVPPTWKVFGQMVRHVDNGTTGAELVAPPNATAVSPNFPVSDMSFTPNINQPADDVVFNLHRRQFLAVWYDSRGAGDVFARHFGVDGSVGGPEIDVSDANGNQGLASVAYDWQRQRYMFAYQGSHPASPPGQEVLGIWGRILDGNGQALTGLIELGYGAYMEADIVYLPEAEAFLASWTSLPGGRDVVGRKVNWAGQAITNIFPIMASGWGEGAPNAVYHPDARNVVVSAMHDNKHIVGITLDAHGAVSGGGFDLSTVSPGQGAGSFYSELAAGPSGQLGVGYILNYTAAVLDRHQGPVAATPGPRPGGGGGVPGCSWAVGLTALNASPLGDSLTVPVSTTSGCGWSAASNASWISRLSSDGSGPGLAVFSASPNNTGMVRLGTVTVAGHSVGVRQTPYSLRLDVNFDGLNDILWQNRATGHLAIWRMNGLARLSGELLQAPPVPDGTWRVAGTFDANRDGHTDILWQQDDGDVTIWLMSGTEFVAYIDLPPVTPVFTIVATADVNSDGWGDIIWQHNDGTVAVWYLRGGQLLAGEVLAQVDSDWRIWAAADFDADMKPDLLWRHRDTGQVAIWFMDGRQRLSAELVDHYLADTNWEIVGVGDYNFDGRADLLWRDWRDGVLAAWFMYGSHMINGLYLNPPAVHDTAWRIVGPK